MDPAHSSTRLFSRLAFAYLQDHWISEAGVRNAIEESADM
jgi:hypothetical protein